MNQKTLFVKFAAAAGLLVLSASAFGQSGYRMLAGPVGSEIRVRWGGARPFPPEGVVLERKDAGDWKQVGGPFKAESDPARLQQILGANLEPILKQMGLKSVQELPAAFQQQFLWAQVIAVRYPELAVAMGTWYVDKDVRPGVGYSYRLKAGGSVAGSVEGVTLGKELPVAPPGELKAQTGVTRNGVYLEWPKNPDKQLAGTIVLRAEQEAGPFNRLNSQLIPTVFSFGFKTKETDKAKMSEMTPFHADLTAEAGKQYFYRVVNVNLLGQESASSKTVSVTVKDVQPPMPPPTAKAALRENKQVDVSWEGSPSAGVAGYLVFRGRNPGKLDTKVTPISLGPDARTFTDTAPPSGSVQCYAVAALSKSGVESGKTLGGVLQIPDLIPPGAPTGLSVALAERTASLTWAANKDADVRGYKVYRADSEKSAFVCITSTPTSGPKFSESLPGETEGEIWYKVSAVDKAGNEGAQSAPARLALPNVRPPSVPQIAYARSNADCTISVKWDAGVAPDLAGVTIERSESDAADAVWTPVNGGKPFPKETTEYRDAGVIAGKQYFYRAIAADTAGNKTSPSMVASAFARSAAPPPAPKGLTARIEPGTTGVILAWEASPAKDIAAYRVYRSFSAAGTWELIGATDAMSFVDSQAQAGITCFYRVSILDSSGNESEPSASVSIASK